MYNFKFKNLCIFLRDVGFMACGGVYKVCRCVRFVGRVLYPAFLINVRY